jgi:hypothetical protein
MVRINNRQREHGKSHKYFRYNGTQSFLLLTGMVTLLLTEVEWWDISRLCSRKPKPCAENHVGDPNERVRAFRS